MAPASELTLGYVPRVPSVVACSQLMFLAILCVQLLISMCTTKKSVKKSTLRVAAPVSKHEAANQRRKSSAHAKKSLRGRRRSSTHSQPLSNSLSNHKRPPKPRRKTVTLTDPEDGVSEEKRLKRRKKMLSSLKPPRDFTRDTKQERIIGGEMRNETDYPTMDDVLSDWTSNQSDAGSQKKLKEKRTKKRRADSSDAPKRKTPSPEKAPSVVCSESERMALATTATAKSKPLTNETMSPPMHPMLLGASAEKERTKEECTTQDDSSVEKLLTVEPDNVVVPASGGCTTHLLINPTPRRLAFKMKCTDNAIYRLSPVFGFIEGNGTSRVTVRRLDGPPKNDRIEICLKEADQADIDSRALFFGNRTYVGVLNVSLCAQ